MIKNKLFWLWYILIAISLCVICIIFYPSIIFTEILYIAFGYAVVEFFILVILSVVLQKLNMITSWKLIAYHAVILTVGIIINILSSPIEHTRLLVFDIAVFVIFVFLNFEISKIVFDINILKAFVIGLITGLINALTIIVSISVYC
jgi:hypothetical protein